MKLRSSASAATAAAFLLASCTGGSEQSVSGSIVEIDDDLQHLSVCSDGQIVEVRLKANYPYELSKAHLDEHMDTGEPVRLVLDDLEGEPTASAILDAKSDDRSEECTLAESEQNES